MWTTVQYREKLAILCLSKGICLVVHRWKQRTVGKGLLCAYYRLRDTSRRHRVYTSASPTCTVCTVHHECCSCAYEVNINQPVPCLLFIPCTTSREACALTLADGFTCTLPTILPYMHIHLHRLV